MAAALISPNTPYHHQHHNSFGSGYSHPAPPTNMAGLISPVEPRRPSDGSDNAHPHRQSLPSLPSISEVFSERKSLGYAPPPSAGSAPGLPSPFTSAPPSRPFGEVRDSDKNTSPRTLQPTSSTFPRGEPHPAFSDPPRPSLGTRPVPPPLNTFSGQQPSPPVKLEQLEAEHRHAEAQSLSAGHRPPPPLPSQQPLPGLYAETGRLPPGQLPLCAYPTSPRHNGPPLPSPYDAQRTPAYGDDADYPQHRSSDYKANFDKHFQTNGYQDALQAIMSSCRTGYHFAEAYVAAAREQQGSQPIPSRMPTENEVSSLLNNLVFALRKLEEVRDMVQQNRIQNERARDTGGGRSPEDEDVAMYGGDGIKPAAYAMHEVKKRRGRAAPPGRCHSCNRVDTPEWRRGPDGARTLCNACGLHYAKLERKRQLDQRSIRPKPAEERK
ncbi:hypothetical protein N658DRAFT_419508 [Parathielavia hyrcaniae]|uniref:GATA-type domain-containing protein n=1 Tax=Parathielavia hyrcaniae TaxID=113614 RepID=A0AAN6Q8D1_9PEZI|nr:hypothetical protein N658DRAFT_419508 [Parathielavia hyrcaniae]